jgi:hypothetical protein
MKFDSRQGQDIFLCSVAALGLIQPPIWWIPARSFPGDKFDEESQVDLQIPF